MRRTAGLLALLAAGCGRATPAADAPPAPAAVAPPAVVVAAPLVLTNFGFPNRPAGFYFPTAVGTKWVYEERMYGERVDEYVETVTGAIGIGPVAVVTVERAGGAVEHVIVTPGRLDRVTATDKKAVPFFVNSVTRSRELGESPRSRARVGGAFTSREPDRPERVAVPAGEFDAVPVVTYPSAESSLALVYSLREWYAPGVGLVRRTAGPTEVVLKAFAPGGD